MISTEGWLSFAVYGWVTIKSGKGFGFFSVCEGVTPGTHRMREPQQCLCIAELLRRAGL